jgi:hypothetical protein
MKRILSNFDTYLDLIMSLSLAQLLEWYSSQLDHPDEKIFIVFHSCMIEKGFRVIGSSVIKVVFLFQ